MTQDGRSTTKDETNGNRPPGDLKMINLSHAARLHLTKYRSRKLMYSFDIERNMDYY